MSARAHVEPLEEGDGRDLLAVDRDRDAALEADEDLLGLVGRLLGVLRQTVDRLGDRVERVGGARPLHGRAPDVLGDREAGARVLPLAQVVRRAVLGELVEPEEAELAERGEHLDVRGEGRGRGLEPDLVVGLARAAVGEEVGVLLADDLDELGHDERPGEGRRERVTRFVDGSGAERRPDVALDELLPEVAHVRRVGADLERLLARLLGRTLLAHVGREGDDRESLLLLEKVERGHGPEAAGERQNCLRHQHQGYNTRCVMSRQTRVTLEDGGRVPTLGGLPMIDEHAPTIDEHVPTKELTHVL